MMITSTTTIIMIMVIIKMILQCCNNDVDHNSENMSLVRINNLRNVATTVISAAII